MLLKWSEVKIKTESLRNKDATRWDAIYVNLCQENIFRHHATLPDIYVNTWSIARVALLEQYLFTTKPQNTWSVVMTVLFKRDIAYICLIQGDYSHSVIPFILMSFSPKAHSLFMLFRMAGPLGQANHIIIISRCHPHQRVAVWHGTILPILQCEPRHRR